jgi:hypothetical protein
VCVSVIGRYDLEAQTRMSTGIANTWQRYGSTVRGARMSVITTVITPGIEALGQGGGHPRALGPPLG